MGLDWGHSVLRVSSIWKDDNWACSFYRGWQSQSYNFIVLGKTAMGIWSPMYSWETSWKREGPSELLLGNVLTRRGTEKGALGEVLYFHTTKSVPV